MKDRLARLLGPDAIELLDDYIRSHVEEALDLRERERRWLSVPDAAEYGGTTPGGIRKRVARNTIPHTRDGGRVLIDRHAWDRLLEAERR